MCGWGLTGDPNVPNGYVCGGRGPDPSGNEPIACPRGLRPGTACVGVTGFGCCDSNGDLYYCTGTGEEAMLFFEECPPALP